jgi:Sugar (and other) transporter
MPTRIRSTGMGFALVLNQAVGTGIAAVFLPTVGHFGYSTMFFFWAGCTVISFVTAAFFLPETKGKTLEEIEEYFETAERKRGRASPRLAPRSGFGAAGGRPWCPPHLLLFHEPLARPLGRLQRPAHRPTHP